MSSRVEIRYETPELYGRNVNRLPSYLKGKESFEIDCGGTVSHVYYFAGAEDAADFARDVWMHEREYGVSEIVIDLDE